MKQLLGVLAIALSLAGTGCRQVDLATALSVTDVFTGWYHVGVVDGLNKLVPSFTFRLENVSDSPVNRVQLLVSFWQDGADGEIDSKQVTGIGTEDLPPSASTDPLLIRSDFGYTLEQSEQELFQHSYFRDFTVKLFARSGGRLVPLGEFPIERRIIPRVTSQP